MSESVPPQVSRGFNDQPDDQPAPGVRVTIVICTYRRPEELTRLLLRLGRQEFGNRTGPQFDVVVIDNSPDGEAAAVVATLAGRIGYPLRLVHVGAGNISVARNRGIDELPPDAQFVLWLDDDELPVDGWLDAMLTARELTGADVVIGPVLGDVPSDAAPWLRENHLYDALPQLPDLVALTEGITGNALIATDTLHRLGLRFDESLGQAGGEDQLFFRTAAAAGVTLRFAAKATVHETVPAGRLTVKYLIRREYRKGNTLGILDRGLAPNGRLRAGQLPSRPLRRIAAAGWWFVSGLAGAIRATLARDRTALVPATLRMVRAAGMLTGLLRLRFDHYGPATPPSRPRALIVIREDPDFQEAGHTRYLHSWIEHLQLRGFDVVLALIGSRTARLTRRDGAEGPVLLTPGSLEVLSRTVIVSPRLVVNSLVWRTLRRVPSTQQAIVLGLRDRWRRGQGVDHDLGAPLTDDHAKWLVATIERLSPGVVIYDSIFTVIPDVLLPGGQLPGSVLASYVITHDVAWQRADAFRQQGYRVTPAGFTSMDEAALLAGAGVPVAITDRDAASFRHMLPGREVLTVAVPAPRVAVTDVARVPGRLLFIGSASLANVDGISWFIDEAWLQIIAADPTATLHVVGSVCGRLTGSWPGVTLLGEVPELDSEYAAASVVVVPLRTGSGMKVKTVEALAHARPVLSTSVGVQGLEYLEPSPFVVADTPQDLASATLRLLADEQLLASLREAAGHAGRGLGPAEVFREFDRHLDGQLAG